MGTHDQLRQLWLALLDRLTAAVADPNINAATMNVVRDFLRDSGINIRSLSEAKAGLQRLAELSASFDDL